jgi:hypothetical protein
MISVNSESGISVAAMNSTPRPAAKGDLTKSIFAALHPHAARIGCE